MQRVSFDFEVIIVNDASTDSTLSIIEQYRAEHREIKVINNPLNCGYAMSIYNGLCAAQGKYFCLLDGDDYYTVRDKLARQADCLDRDDKEEYVAVTSEYIVDLGGGMVYIPPRTGRREMTYADVLTSNHSYYHVSAYMYRNIFRGNVPALFKSKHYEGDTPMLLFLLHFSNRKVRILDSVGSAYTYEYRGIWSGMTVKKQHLQTISYLKNLEKDLPSAFEKRCVEKKKLAYLNALDNTSDSMYRFPSTVKIDECLERIKAIADKFAFEQEDFLRGGLYTSEYLDTLVASLGYIKRIRGGHRNNSVNQTAVCISIGDLPPGEDGIWHEISQLVDLYRDKRVYLFLAGTGKLQEETLQFAKAHSNLNLVCPATDENDRLDFFISRMEEISPFRAYYYCSHNDVFGMAMMGSSTGCENIMLFSLNCGYICGIHNPNLDSIIARRPVDYYMLRRYFGEKVIYVPLWSDLQGDSAGLAYKPFDCHDVLITASGTEHFDEIDVQFPCSYVEYIIQLLKRTQGVHYHYGSIPEDKLETIYQKLTSIGVPCSRFVHVSRAENQSRDMLERHVDIFIEPFPVVSYKMTLDVMSVGIPVICWDGVKRTSVSDFVPPEMPRWHNLAEFIAILYDMDEKQLTYLSVLVKHFFSEFFTLEAVAPVFLGNRSFTAPPHICCSDDALQDISSLLRIFGDSYSIKVT